MADFNQSIQSEVSAPAASPVDWLNHHALLAYFALAFGGPWLLFLPLVVSDKHLGVLAVPDPLLLGFFWLATLAAPFLAAFVVAGVTDGVAGLRQLCDRIAEWQSGLRRYLLGMLGYFLLFLVGLSVVVGGELLEVLFRQWPLFLGFYLPNLLPGLFIPLID